MLYVYIFFFYFLFCWLCECSHIRVKFEGLWFNVHQNYCYHNVNADVYNHHFFFFIFFRWMNISHQAEETIKIFTQPAGEKESHLA